MLGFMISTWFLSMWISNTATTAMMIPIVTAVADEIVAQKKPDSSGDDPGRCLLLDFTSSEKQLRLEVGRCGHSNVF